MSLSRSQIGRNVFVAQPACEGKGLTSSWGVPALAIFVKIPHDSPSYVSLSLTLSSL